MFAGISSWGRKVGRRLELLTIADSETLTYNVNPGYSRPSQFSRSVSRSRQTRNIGSRQYAEEKERFSRTLQINNSIRNIKGPIWIFVSYFLLKMPTFQSIIILFDCTVHYAGSDIV